MEEKKELSMETRLLLAFLLMGLVLFGTQYFYKPPAPAPASSSAAAKTSAPAKPEEPVAVPVKPATAVEMPGQIQAGSEESVTVDTDFYHVVFSNRGAVVKSWILKAYKDHNGKPLDVVNQAAAGKVPDPFSISLKRDAAAAAINSGLYKLSRTGDGLSLDFEYSDGKIDAKKIFKFTQVSYLVTVDTQVLDNGVPAPHSIEWRGGFGDETVVNPANDQHAVYYDLNDSKLRENDAKTAKNGPVSVNGRVSFAGAEDKYFAGVFLPAGHSQIEVTTYSDTVPGADNKDVQAVGVGVGGEGVNVFSLFVGPKDTDLLKKVDPKLQQLIDWGWFEILAKPLFLVVNWTAHFVKNWGWAIVLVTVAINLLLFPLRLTQMKSAKKMQRLQPQIKAINEKYKNISMRDPKKAEQNAEIMELYKKEGVNPMGGCFPMIIQLPFLYAFWKVLSVSIEMRGAPWLWVSDLSQPETIPIRMLPVLLVVTSFLMQKMTPSPGVDPSQQKMMYFMPLIFGYMFYYLPSGLVLYYLTSNLVGMALQWLLNRGGAPPAAVVDVKPAPKRKR